MLQFCSLFSFLLSLTFPSLKLSIVLLPVFTLQLVILPLFQWKNKNNEEKVFMNSLPYLSLHTSTSPHLTSCQPPSPLLYCKKGQTLDLYTRHHLLLPTPGKFSITTPFTTFWVSFSSLPSACDHFHPACEYDKRTQSLNPFPKLCLLKLLTLNTISEFITVKFKFLLQASPSIQIWIFHDLFLYLHLEFQWYLSMTCPYMFFLGFMIFLNLAKATPNF